MIKERIPLVDYNHKEFMRLLNPNNYDRKSRIVWSEIPLLTEVRNDLVTLMNHVMSTKVDQPYRTITNKRHHWEGNLEKPFLAKMDTVPDRIIDIASDLLYDRWQKQKKRKQFGLFNSRISGRQTLRPLVRRMYRNDNLMFNDDDICNLRTIPKVTDVSGSLINFWEVCKQDYTVNEVKEFLIQTKAVQKGVMVTPVYPSREKYREDNGNWKALHENNETIYQLTRIVSNWRQTKRGDESYFYQLLKSMKYEFDFNTSQRMLQNVNLAESKRVIMMGEDKIECNINSDLYRLFFSYFLGDYTLNLHGKKKISISLDEMMSILESSYETCSNYTNSLEQQQQQHTTITNKDQSDYTVAETKVIGPIIEPDILKLIEAVIVLKFIEDDQNLIEFRNQPVEQYLSGCTSSKHYYYKLFKLVIVYAKEEMDRRFKLITNPCDTAAGLKARREVICDLAQELIDGKIWNTETQKGCVGYPAGPCRCGDRGLPITELELLELAHTKKGGADKPGQPSLSSLDENIIQYDRFGLTPLCMMCHNINTAGEFGSESLLHQEKMSEHERLSSKFKRRKQAKHFYQYYKLVKASKCCIEGCTFKTTFANMGSMTFQHLFEDKGVKIRYVNDNQEVVYWTILREKLTTISRFNRHGFHTNQNAMIQMGIELKKTMHMCAKHHYLIDRLMKIQSNQLPSYFTQNAGSYVIDYSDIKKKLLKALLQKENRSPGYVGKLIEERPSHLLTMLTDWYNDNDIISGIVCEHNTKKEKSPVTYVSVTDFLRFKKLNMDTGSFDVANSRETAVKVVGTSIISQITNLRMNENVDNDDHSDNNNNMSRRASCRRISVCITIVNNNPSSSRSS